MSLKHVLVVSQVIPQWYVDLLTKALGEECQIDIITGSTEIRGNIIPSPKHNAESLKSRLGSWMKHFIFMNHWMKKNKNQKYDMIFAVSNPPINSYIGLQLKKHFNAPFVYMNWDLYPQVIESTIKNPIVRFSCKLWHKWNNANYPKIDKMLTIGEIMADSMRAPMKNALNIDVIPISVDVERLTPIHKRSNPFCIKNQLTDKFIVLYSGKMGMGHNIEIILEASKLLPEVTFVFIGNGPKYCLVEEHIKNNQSGNVQLYPLQSEAMFPYSMACGDIGIVTQEAGMAHLFMPSKTYSMMACGEAIIGICTEHDDLYSLLEKNEFGIAITEVEAKNVAEEISELYKDKEKLETMKMTSRHVAVEEYSNSVLEQRYERIFSDLL